MTLTAEYRGKADFQGLQYHIVKISTEAEHVTVWTEGNTRIDHEMRGRKEWNVAIYDIPNQVGVIKVRDSKGIKVVVQTQ